MPRTTKSEKQRAEEALAVADRKVLRAAAKVADARATLNDLEDALDDLKALQEHAAAHPALPASELTVVEVAG